MVAMGAVIAVLVGCAPAPKVSAGPNAATGEQALAYFKGACLDTVPSFDGAETYLLQEGFVRDDSTIFYHPTLDLSVDVHEVNSGLNCSVGFRSDENVAELGMAFGLQASNKARELGRGGRIEHDPNSGSTRMAMTSLLTMTFHPAGSVSDSNLHGVLLHARNT